MRKIAFLFMVLTICSKLLGFIREIVLAYFFGASTVSDAFLVSGMIPVIIFGVIGAGVSTGYIPIYTRISSTYGKKEGLKFTNNIINILLIISTLIFILGQIYTSELIKVFASGFSGETLALTIKFTRISLFGIYFSSLIYILTGMLHANSKFNITALIGIPLNVITILSIVLSAYWNVMIIAIGALIAIVIQFTILYVYAYRSGYRYKFSLDLKNENAKKNALDRISSNYRCILGSN